MRFVDPAKIAASMTGVSIPKPVSGTLSGHAAGEPFDKYVYHEIKKQFPNHSFRQYEYLNDLFTKNPKIIGFEGRQALFDSPTVLFLLSRGKNAIDSWKIEHPFDEKQNDTADVLIVKDGFYEIIDVKTRNIDKKAQPPNIISAYKLAQVCAKMFGNEEFDRFSLNYFEIDWRLKDEFLCCENVYSAELFKTFPQELYINWAEAMQIQFHVSDLEQNFTGTIQDWAKLYLQHFVAQARKRSEDMITKFVKPFEKYL